MFSFILTADGSPTVRIGAEESNQSEAMHSLKGAFSETVYIYGDAVKFALNKKFEPFRVLSIGLGMGYIELLTVAIAISRDAMELLSGESFEIVPELRDYFRGWVLSQPGIPQDFVAAYEDILSRTAQETGVEAELIRKTLGLMLEDERWLLRGALESTTEFKERFSCICFDAFSSKSTPDLWTEEFLDDLFSQVCAPGCVLSTYACTGKLKRSLRKAGFTLNIREGFSSKRDSTFASREPIS
jgi:hypothetical protein